MHSQHVGLTHGGYMPIVLSGFFSSCPLSFMINGLKGLGGCSHYIGGKGKEIGKESMLKRIGQLLSFRALLLLLNTRTGHE